MVRAVTRDVQRVKKSRAVIAARPFVLPPLVQPNTVQPHDDGYLVPGVALVKARPHRRPFDAARLAKSIAGEPSAYLSVCNGFHVPGVVDLRPTFTGRGAL